MISEQIGGMSEECNVALSKNGEQISAIDAKYNQRSDHYPA
jgi:hypothetical protein